MLLTEYDSPDLAPILELVRTCYPDTAEPEEWWQWRHRGRVDAPSRFLVAMEEGRVVGLRPVSMFPMWHHGKSLTAAMFTAVMVHPDYRGRGLFRALVERGKEYAWDQGASLIFTMPNERSWPLFLREGWTDPGLRRFFVRPLHPSGITTSRMGTSLPVRTLGSILDLFAGALMPKPALSSRVLNLERFPEDTDALDARVAAGNPGMAVQRGKAMTDWRLIDTKYYHYECFGIRDANSLLGYVATRTETREGVNIGYIVDLHGEEPGILRTLVDAALQRFLDEGMHLASAVLTDPTHCDALKSRGFLAPPRRLTPRPFRLVWLARPGLESRFTDLHRIEAWRLTLADFDGI